MALYVYWFTLALVVLGIEMATGTFYLLVVSIAMALGGFAALLGASIAWQLTLCALGVMAGTIMLRQWKNGSGKEAVYDDLDIGQSVQIIKWHENGSARVQYRGAEWDASPESTDMPREGTFYIKSVHGSNLILTHHKP